MAVKATSSPHLDQGWANLCGHISSDCIPAAAVLGGTSSYPTLLVRSGPCLQCGMRHIQEIASNFISHTVLCKIGAWLSGSSVATGCLGSNTITGWCQQSTQPCVLPMNKVAEEAVQELCKSLSSFWTHTPPPPILSGSQGTFLLIFFRSCL